MMPRQPPTGRTSQQDHVIADCYVRDPVNERGELHRLSCEVTAFEPIKVCQTRGSTRSIRRVGTVVSVPRSSTRSTHVAVEGPFGASPRSRSCGPFRPAAGTVSFRFTPTSLLPVSQRSCVFLDERVREVGDGASHSACPGATDRAAPARRDGTPTAVDPLWEAHLPILARTRPGSHRGREPTALDTPSAHTRPR